MDLKYPQWQEPLAAAILELNRDLLLEKAQKAGEAIAQRIEQLAFDHGNEYERRGRGWYRRAKKRQKPSLAASNSHLGR